jgi:hypothetical protein
MVFSAAIVFRFLVQNLIQMPRVGPDESPELLRASVYRKPTVVKECAPHATGSDSSASPSTSADSPTVRASSELEIAVQAAQQRLGSRILSKLQMHVKRATMVTGF